MWLKVRPCNVEFYMMFYPFLGFFQNILTDFKSIRSSKAFQLVNDQLQKSQAELDDNKTLLEKLQVVTGQ